MNLEAVLSSEKLSSVFFNFGLVDLGFFSSIFAFEQFKAEEVVSDDALVAATEEPDQLERLIAYQQVKKDHPDVFEGLRDVSNLQEYLLLSFDEREELCNLAELNTEYWQGKPESRLSNSDNGRVIRSQIHDPYRRITTQNQITTFLQNYKQHIILEEITDVTLTTYAMSFNTLTGEKIGNGKGTQNNLYRHWHQNKIEKCYPDSFDEWAVSYLSNKDFREEILNYSIGQKMGRWKK